MVSWDQQRYSRETIIENKMIAPHAYLLIFRRNFSFTAGQVVGLGLKREIEPRIYSIASGENDSLTDIIYTEKPSGKFTPMLSLLRSGDSILVSEPFGNYTDCSEDAVWIATGTGIAPFISMLKSGKGQKATLIHGVRTSNYFYYSEYLRKILGDNYIQCCSGSDDKTYYNGRVTHYLEAQTLSPNKKYYLCGVAEMVVDTRDLLISKGIPFSNIFAEIYF